MARRNRNTDKRQRRPQARKRGIEDIALGRGKPRLPGQPPPIALDKMVLPTGRCGRKLIFSTPEDAQKALRQANQNRRRNGQTYHESRYYLHDVCGGYHLTSREFRP